MKKVFISIVLFSAIFFTTGCASTIKKPAAKNSTLLYGVTDFIVDFDLSHSGLNRYRTVSNVKIFIKNTKTEKIYTGKSNERGEIIFQNIPLGAYCFTKASCDFIYKERNWNVWLKCDEDSSEFNFNVNSGVTNLGKIAIMYNTENASGLLKWAYNYELARNIFEQEYSDSPWLSETWTDTNQLQADTEIQNEENKCDENS